MTDPIIKVAEAAVPGLGEVKAGLAVAKALWPLLAAVGGLGAIGAGLLYVHHLQADNANLKTERDQARAGEISAQEKTKATAEADQVADRGQAKADVTVHLEQEHRNAILSAPGAGQAVDPDLYRDLVGGMCAYAASAGDTRCDPVRGADTRPLSPAGEGNGDPRPDGRRDLGGAG